MKTVNNKSVNSLRIFLMKMSGANKKVIGGYKIVDTLNSGISCDNCHDFRTGCKNNAKYCLSRTFLWVNGNLECEDHVHVCESCAQDLLGKTHDFR